MQNYSPYNREIIRKLLPITLIIIIIIIIIITRTFIFRKKGVFTVEKQGRRTV
jgi:hypothetical protein